MAHALVFLLLAHLLIFLSNPIAILAAESTNNSKIDQQALLNFRLGITDPLGVLHSWGNGTFCSWRGVTCGKNLPLRVVSLDLNSLQLVGQLSTSLANLTSITKLDLGSNSLFGSIPEELGTLPKLQDLILANNSLSGIIPASLFKDSSRLEVINLKRNFLNGSIPDLHNIATLQTLNLAENQLSGSIPSSIGNISSLRYILLDQNKLTGSIPESLGQISKLVELDLSFNSLSGYIPLPLYKLSSLKYFSLGSNGLVGQLPSDIGYTLPNLQVLVMQSNNLEGLIPVSLENVSNLQVLDLSNNSLHGRIPSLGLLAKLRQVLLGRNQLEAYEWKFLSSLTNCAQLTKLSLEGNMLKGSLPASIGNLSTGLEYLALGSNQISGSIPIEISNLVNLTMLSMENNLLSGSIPAMIGKLQNLFVLNLSKNKLSGQIPSTIGSIAQLGKLFLDDNNLSGNVPKSLDKCLRLVQLNLSSNSLDGMLPKEMFAGTPMSLGLDLSFNNLTGEIPEIFSQAELIILLNISNNMFSGTIPYSLMNLRSIEYLNLSRNVLSGSVPGFFERLTMLKKLDLSYNNFNGLVPTGELFQNSSIVILDGNKGLCSMSSTLVLPVCDEPKNHGVPLLPVVIPSVTIALLLLLWFLVTLLNKRVFEFPWWEDILRMICLLAKAERREIKTFLHSNGTLKKVSYSDILRATNWFSPVNRISSTRSGSVYVGRFKFETDTVAIKVFNLNERGAHDNYLTECEVLRIIRHRNILKSVTLCSSLDAENNEFKAIVFQFMANGSLERWLHPNQQTERPMRRLTLGQRICIVTDVASALDYLHNQLVPPLVHCDLKPSNVLLDYDMTARVGDFGSAKFFLPDSGCLKHSVLIQGTIGYLATDYVMGCGISTRCDVYSFGVLLLEILTGKRPTDEMFVDGLNLHKFSESMFPDRLAEILDPHMLHEESQTCTEVWMQRYIIPLVALGLSCSIESPKERPGMQDVCAKLSAIKQSFSEVS